MKTRIIAAAVLVPVLFLIVLVAPESAAAAILGILLAIASYELLYRTGLVKHPRLVVYSSAMAFALSMWSYFGAVRAYFVLMLMVYAMVLFAEMMLDHIKVHFETICMCFVSGVIIPYLLTSLIRILTMDIGRYVILIPFIVAFMSDAGAYFVGLKFGKHKLAPVVSPNKTIEGVFGGLAGATIGMLIYTIILDWPAVWRCRFRRGHLRRPVLLHHQAADRHQGLWQPDSRSRRCAGSVRFSDHGGPFHGGAAADPAADPAVKGIHLW